MENNSFLSGLVNENPHFTPFRAVLQNGTPLEREVFTLLHLEIHGHIP